MNRSIDITSAQRETLLALLKQHLPQTTAWVYGSRVQWTARPQSDLDMVVFASPSQNSRVSALKEALDESNLPFRVDLFVWDDVPDQFRKQIEAEYAVLVKKKALYKANEWSERLLGELIDIKHGFAFKGDYIQDKPPGDILLTPGNFAIGGGFKMEKFKYYNGPVPEAFVLNQDDLIVTMTDLSKNADTLGYPAMVPRGNEENRFLHNQRLGKVNIKKSDTVEIRYIYYVMCSENYRHEILASATGTTVKHTSPERIKRFSLNLPPLAEQRAIAHILGTLDDKIELNRRMNETLEAMAQALFKSWFVDFDPVHAKATLPRSQPSSAVSFSATPPPGGSEWTPEHARAYLDSMDDDIMALFPDSFEDSELGKIPMGWEVKKLEENGTIITGKTPSTRNPNFYGNDVPLLKIPDMHGKIYVVETSTMLSIKGASSQPTKSLPSGSVSVSCIASPGLVVLNHQETHTNQQINSIIPIDKQTSKYLFWTCRKLSTEIISGSSGGSIFGNMNKSTFGALQILSPESTLVRMFDFLISPIHNQILLNEQQGNLLTHIRDTLLPKLVSGKIRIHDIEKLKEATI